MRILMFCPGDVYQQPGPRTGRTLALAAELTDRGHDVKVVYQLVPETLAVEQARYRQEHPFETIPFIRQSTTFLKKAAGFRRLMDWADVVHVQGTDPAMALPALLAAYQLGKPFHLDWDQWDSEAPDPGLGRRSVRWPLKAAERLLPKLVDSVSAPATPLRQLAEAFGVRPDRAFFAPPGTDLTLFHPDRDGSEVRRALGLRPPIVLYLGQPENVEYFLRCCLAIREEVGEVHFLIKGEIGTMKPIVERFPAYRRVRFTGHEAYSDWDLHAAATHAVGCYTDSPFERCRAPVEVIEAMASGTPVVATAVGEIPGVLAESGYKVNPGDFSMQVRSLEMLLTDHGKSVECGKKQREIAEERCRWAIAAEAILDAYERILDDRSVRRIFRGTGGGRSASGGEGEAPEVLRNDPFRGASRLVKENLDLLGVLGGGAPFMGPREVQLDVTNQCNNDCLACWSFSPLLGDKGMPHEEKALSLPITRLEPLIDELATLGTRKVYLAGGGDPWMHPHLLRILERIKRRGMSITLHTNFSLVDREKAERLVELGVDHLTVSLWAATPGTYARNHPNKAEETFLRIEETLRYLVRVRGGLRKPFIKSYNVLSRLNVHEFRPMVRFARELGLDAVEFAPVDTIPDRTESLLITEAQRQRLLEEIPLVEEEVRREGAPHLFEFDMFVGRVSQEGTLEGEHDRENVKALPCTIGYHFARVMADGKVTPCMKGDRIPIGNIWDSSFAEIWASARHDSFRDKARLIPREDPFFHLIGKDPKARVGCYKSCDDIGRNRHVQDRLKALNWRERLVLRLAVPYYRLTGKALT